MACLFIDIVKCFNKNVWNNLIPQMRVNEVFSEFLCKPPVIVKLDSRILKQPAIVDGIRFPVGHADVLVAWVGL